MLSLTRTATQIPIDSAHDQIAGVGRMGQFLAKMLESISWGHKNLSIVMLGLDAAGKQGSILILLAAIYDTFKS